MNPRIAILVTILALLSSCESIHDSRVDCGVWLEFAFDHNMEYTDALDPHVESVSAYIFDSEGRYVETRTAQRKDLVGGNRMWLGDELPQGRYRVLTVGNMSSHFEVKHTGGDGFTRGASTIDQAQHSLRHTGVVSHKFNHFYFGHAVDVNHQSDMGVHRVALMRQTNNFNVALLTSRESVPEGTVEGAIAPSHTVEITAPEAGSYDWNNMPTNRTTTLYQPHTLQSRIDFTEDGIEQLTAANLNTMRLLEDEWDGYRITVRNIDGGAELWSHDLLPLLAATKPATKPDGTALSNAEFFDRQGEWNIVIVYLNDGGPTDIGDPTDPEGFAAIKIIVNGWIVWQTGMGIGW